MTLFSRFAFASLTAALLSSCGSDGSNIHPDLEPLATPAGGQAFYTPIMKVAKGADVTYCTFTDVITTQRILVHDTKGAQTPYGHHAIMFFSPVPQPVGTIPCEAADMENFRQLLGGTGGEGMGFWSPPANVASEVPAGAQIVIQSHWTNYGDADADVQAMMVTFPHQEAADTVLAGPTAVVNTRFRIPANSMHTDKSECVFNKDKRFMLFLGHMHERGRHVKIEIARAAGGTPEMLMDKDFSPAEVFEPPLNSFPLNAPQLIKQGDKLTVTCDWQNNTGEMLEFPREMCVFFGYSMDGETANCVNGSWE